MNELQEDWITAIEVPAKPERIRIALGIHEGLSNADYHSDPAVGSTGLKRILQSPAHFKYPPKRNSTRNMEIGTAIHCQVLEPDRFAEQYKIVECDARTSALYKAACKGFDKERVLTSLEYENVLGMRLGVLRNKSCMELVEAEGRYELSLFTKDPVTGLDVKVRYDKLTNSGMPIDLKKTQKADKESFRRTIHNYGYHISAAFYMDCWFWQFGETLDVMRWLAVEEQSPHAAMRYKPDADALMIGRAMYREALEVYDRCLQNDEWPIYGDQDDEEISLPNYAISQFEDELEVELAD